MDQLAALREHLAEASRSRRGTRSAPPKWRPTLSDAPLPFPGTARGLSLGSSFRPATLARHESVRRASDSRVWGSWGLQGYEHAPVLAHPNGSASARHESRFQGRGLATPSHLPARFSGIAAPFERLAATRPGSSGHARGGNTCTKSRHIGLPPPSVALTWKTALTAPRGPSTTSVQGRPNTSASDRNHPLDLPRHFPDAFWS